MGKKINKITLLVTVLILLSGGSALAHSGRTDSNGGHNCNVGACAGTYHYHNGGSAPSAPTYSAPKPRTPVVSKQVKTEDIVINFNETTEYDSHEYNDYFKVESEGSNGSKKVSTQITYTDGTETGRDSPTTTIITPAVSKKIIKGSRIRPEAKITHIEKTKKKDKYDVYGEFRSNSEVVLSINGKKVKRTKTDKDGKFVFKGQKIKAEKVDLIVFKREKRKENQVSEKTHTDVKNQKLKTEYDSLHNR